MRACFGSNFDPGGPPGSYKPLFSSHSPGKKKVHFPVVGHGYSQKTLSAVMQNFASGGFAAAC